VGLVGEGLTSPSLPKPPTKIRRRRDPMHLLSEIWLIETARHIAPDFNVSHNTIARLR
jgi:hypothetical protein